MEVFTMTTQYFTNENGFWQSREVFPADLIPGAYTATPTAAPTAEGFYGFGVAITGSSCYLLSQMDPAERTALLQYLYGKDGIHLNVGRLSVGSSDYSAELYSYDDVPFDTELKHFSVARDEKYVIPMIREILKINPDIFLFSSPWSPPGWMKTGGSLCGGHMGDEFVPCYVEYYIKFLKAYEAHGIHIQALTPQNEPETHQDGKMPACIWNPETEAKFITLLRKRLNEENMDTKIWIWDYRFTGIDRVLWSLDNIPELKESCAGAAFHYYKGNIEQTLKLREKYPDIVLHFTEGGPRLYDHYDNDWCKWGLMISKAMRCGYRSFTGWNLMLDENGSPNIGPYFCGGLVTKNSQTGELSYSGQMKAMAHISPYLNADSKIFPLIIDEITHNSMFTYPKVNELADGFLIDNNDQTICIMVNGDKEKKQYRIFVKDRWYYIELLPNSISTIIF